MEKLSISTGSYILLNGYPKKIEEILKEIFPQQIANPDVLFIEGEESIGINQVRQIKKFLQIKSWQGGKKVVIVQEGEKLTVEAQNALLKILEEPGENNIIIIKTKNPQQLLPTVISRCHILRGKEDKQKGTDAFFVKLLILPLDKKIQFLTKIRKESPEPGKLIEKMIIEGQNNLIFGPKKQLAKTSQVISKLLAAQKMLRANINPEQVFDWLAISL